jgi:HAD superfamily hydrolase (TIGR01509 family)
MTAACLLDVYDTILTCDFDRVGDELATAAGISAAAWRDGIHDFMPGLIDGRLSLAQLFGHLLRQAGADPAAALVTELVSKDRQLLCDWSRLYDDVVPFLQRLAARGIPVALVSNCAENTRALLDQTGVSALASAVVLSCEAGCAKPSARIYQLALDKLGAPAAGTVFIDDQERYCAAAASLGMTALRISRGGALAGTTAGPVPVIASLLEAEAKL